jgi:hypothetical protein
MTVNFIPQTKALIVHVNYLNDVNIQWLLISSPRLKLLLYMLII